MHERSDRETPTGGPWSSHDLAQSGPQSHRRRGGQRDKACEQRQASLLASAEHDGPKPGQTRMCVKAMHKQTWAQWSRT